CTCEHLGLREERRRRRGARRQRDDARLVSGGVAAARRLEVELQLPFARRGECAHDRVERHALLEFGGSLTDHVNIAEAIEAAGGGTNESPLLEEAQMLVADVRVHRADVARGL